MDGLIRVKNWSLPADLAPRQGTRPSGQYRTAALAVVFTPGSRGQSSASSSSLWACDHLARSKSQRLRQRRLCLALAVVFFATVAAVSIWHIGCSLCPLRWLPVILFDVFAFMYDAVHT